MKNKILMKAPKVLYVVFAVACCWYFFFSSTFTLRPYPQVFWALMAGISIVVAIVHKYRPNKMDFIFVGSLVLFSIFSIFSSSFLGSMKIVASYAIYYICAKMITTNCKGKTIHVIILSFSLVHLVCIYLQVLAPNVYTSVLLPLLPESIHTTIIQQMEWNKAYYGFAVASSMSAMYLSFGAILSWIRAKNSDKILLKIVYIVLAVLFLIGIFFAQRRGSSTVVLLILILICLRYKTKIGTKLFIRNALILFLLLFDIQNIPGVSGLIDKMTQLITYRTIWNGREKIFLDALKAIAQKPLIGWGGGQTAVATGYQWTENGYLQILVQWGILGFAVFTALYVVIVRKTVLDLKLYHGKDDCSEFSLYIQILFILMSIIENYFGDALTLFMFLVIVLAQKEKAKLL